MDEGSEVTVRWMLVMALSVGTANAQTYEAPKVCWLGGAEFSPGTVIRAANGPMMCDASSLTWVETDRAVAGCLKASNVYAPGTIDGDERKDAIITLCQPDGTWKTLN